MMVGDDRAEFEEMKRAEALALGRDDAVFDLSLRTIRAADSMITPICGAGSACPSSNSRRMSWLRRK